MKFAAIEKLISAHERNHLCADEPDHSDISSPPSGITMGMIREARAELTAHQNMSKLLRRLNVAKSK